MKMKKTKTMESILERRVDKEMPQPGFRRRRRRPIINHCHCHCCFYNHRDTADDPAGDNDAAVCTYFSVCRCWSSSSVCCRAIVRRQTNLNRVKMGSDRDNINPNKTIIT